MTTTFLHAAELDAPRSRELTPLLRQRRGLHRALLRLGAHLEALPAPSVRDELFVRERVLFADGGHGARALFCHPEGHANDTGAWARALWARGIPVDEAADAPLSGADVVWVPGRGALLGVGGASSCEAAPTLERFLGCEVRCVEVEDVRFRALEMAVAALDDGTVLAYRRAFAPSSLREIERWIDGELLDVPLGDALEGGLRFVQVGAHVVMAQGAPVVAATLYRRGLAVHTLPLEQIQRAGRGPCALVSRLTCTRARLRRTG